MEYKCTNCVWEGAVLSKKPLKDKCPVCGDNVKQLGSEPVKDVKSEEPVKPPKRSLLDKVEDLIDDGKLNHSNAPSKKRGKR